MRRGCGAAILAFQKRGQIEYNRAVQLLFVAPSRIHALPRVLNPSPSCLRQMAWAGPLLLVLAAYLSSASAANDATTDAVSVRPRNAHPRPRNSTLAKPPQVGRQTPTELTPAPSFLLHTQSEDLLSFITMGAGLSDNWLWAGYGCGAACWAYCQLTMSIAFTTN
jgi:hypothetical protein